MIFKISKMKYFHYSQFRDKNRLLKLKEKRGLSFGVALPTKNEEKTIGKILRIIKKCQPLVDEILVVDSGSTDRTREICKKEGVRVILDRKIAKELNLSLKRGKGWNLWSSVYYLNTDVILWVDSDIKNFHERFILGLIGPFLVDKKIKFIKGYYERPKKDGRVTELVVKPLINFVFPELKKFIQPLSGEYGGRKEFLEKIEFYSGYSVEIALLIQAILYLKEDEIGQVYLKKRIHKLQDISALRRMSGSIIYTLFEFGKKLNRIKINRLPSFINSFIIEKEKMISLREEIRDAKLIPIKKLKKYEEKRN